METGSKGWMAGANERRVDRSVVAAMAHLNRKDGIAEDRRAQPPLGRERQLPAAVHSLYEMASGVDRKSPTYTPVFTSKGKYLLD
jgi:hypothetical protein